MSLTLSLFTHIPPAVAEELQVSRIELEVDWPKLPSLDKSLNDIANEKTDLQQLILFVYTLLLWISAFAAFVALVYAGFLYIVSGASPALRAQAFVRVKRIATGGGILLLSVLILSFINADLIEVDVSINELYCEGVENKEICQRELAYIQDIETGYFNLDFSNFKYPIRAIEEDEFEERLVDSAAWLLQQTINQNNGDGDRVDRRKFQCAPNNTCTGEGDSEIQACEDWKQLCQMYDMNEDEYLNEDDVAYIQNNDVNLLSILDRGCVNFEKKTFNLPGIPSNPLGNLRYLSLNPVSIISGELVDRGIRIVSSGLNSVIGFFGDIAVKDEGKEGFTRRNIESQLSNTRGNTREQCRWAELHKIIKADLDKNHRIKQKYLNKPASSYGADVILDENITLRYVVRGDDDIVPSCMAVCAYSPSPYNPSNGRFSLGVNKTNEMCPGDIFENWNDEDELNKARQFNNYKWQGTVEEDESGSESTTNLQLKNPDNPGYYRENQYKPDTPVCTIGNNGLHDNDFNLTQEGNQDKTEQFAKYVVEAFDVPLVGCSAEIFYSGICEHGSGVVDFRGLNGGSERELVGCYCNTQPAK